MRANFRVALMTALVMLCPLPVLWAVESFPVKLVDLIKQ
jgi:hypothetical protein